ncbi:MAG: undecaprenyl-diphosphate phosphatase [Candidatus Hydrogenedentes bacterium]|nr:undecaprenyl-diphosphate phosphatase [Candidatus Hydrogenedentota bacterium]
MAYINAIILAIIEGATEFLPVSSTGHLILAEEFFSLSPDESFNKAFIIMIQLPAIAAVVLFFWRDLWPFSASAQKRADLYVMWSKIGVAFAPAVALGFLFADMLDRHLLAPLPVGIALFAGGVALILVEKLGHRETVSSVADFTFKMAFFVGLFQCLAMIPGTSRSAATIMGALLLGASRPAAAEFSFFLAIPTMVGATGLTIAKKGLAFSGGEWCLLAIGSVVSFGVAYVVIAAFMSYVKRKDFTIFGYYRIALAGAVFFFLALGRIG